MRRLLFLICFLTLSVTGATAQDFYDGDIGYNIISDTEFKVEAYRLKDENVQTITIPQKVQWNGAEYSVTGIGVQAFDYCSKLVSVHIPESVVSIGKLAFFNCSSLRSIHIPESVTSIGDNAFRNCSSLSSINIPKHVTSFGKGVFLDCSKLASVSIADGVTGLGTGTFKNCVFLTSIHIPGSVKEIGYDSFWGCRSLASVYIEDGVTYISADAFVACESLTSIHIPESVTGIGSGAFRNCSSLASIHIPEGPTSIGEQTFRYCSSLTSIVIPEGVKSIDKNAFDGCSSLASISLPKSLTSINFYAFLGTRLQTIVSKMQIPSKLYEEIFIQNEFNHTQLYVPEGTYWDYAFCDWGNFIHIKEMAMDAEELKPAKAYMIADAKGCNYTVYDARKGTLKNVEYTHSLDEENKGSCWTVLREEGKSYLYNLGAKKFASMDNDGKLVLAVAPVSLDITTTADGISINGNARMFVLNNNINVTADGIEDIRIDNARPEGTGIYSLDGRRLNKPIRGINIVNGSKVVVK